MTRAFNWLDRRNLHPIGSLHRRGHYSICYGPHLDWLRSLDLPQDRPVSQTGFRFFRPALIFLISRSYQDRALLYELQEGKWWTRR